MRYYYFNAVGQGHAHPMDKEGLNTMLKAKNKSSSQSQAMQNLNAILAKSASGIQMEDIYFVNPPEWACPDLGPIQKGDFSDSATTNAFFESAMLPDIESYMTRLGLKAWKLVAMVPNEASGLISALYEDNSASVVMDDFMSFMKTDFGKSVISQSPSPVRPANPAAQNAQGKEASASKKKGLFGRKNK